VSSEDPEDRVGRLDRRLRQVEENLRRLEGLVLFALCGSAAMILAHIALDLLDRTNFP